MRFNNHVLVFLIEMSGVDLVIIVPVFNEQDSLMRFKSEMDAFIQVSDVSASILFVNDGSTDNSLPLIQHICSQNKHYAYISLSANMGLSAAIKAGIDHCSSKWIGYIDADLQTSPADFALMFPYINEFDLVIGHRHQRKDKAVKRISSLVANAFRRRVLKDGVHDTGCPLKIIKTEMARKLPFYKGMHRFIPALVQIQGGNVKEVPVRHFPRIEGKSKYHLSNRIIHPFIDTLAVYWIKKRTMNYQLKE